MEIAVHTVALALNELDQMIYLAVHRQIFDTGTGVTAIVLQSNRMGQLIICQYITVAVIDVTPRTFDGTFFCGDYGKIVGIFFTVDNLQIIDPGKQDNYHDGKHQAKDCTSFQYGFFQ